MTWRRSPRDRDLPGAGKGSDCCRPLTRFPCENPGSSRTPPHLARWGHHDFCVSNPWMPDARGGRHRRRSGTSCLTQLSTRRSSARQRSTSTSIRLPGYCFRRLPADHAYDAVANVFTIAWKKIEQMPDAEIAPCSGFTESPAMRSAPSAGPSVVRRPCGPSWPGNLATPIRARRP